MKTEETLTVKPETPEKVTEILTDNLKESLKAVDLAIALAFTCVVFLLLHGLQGDFSQRRSGAQQQGTTAAPSETAAPERPVRRLPAEDIETTIPYLGIKANLLAASVIALCLYWVFCLRAAFRCVNVKLIARQLDKIDPDILAAGLLLPSSATAGKWGKGLTCAALGVLGLGGYILMYLEITPDMQLILMSGTLVMWLPAGILGWNIWHVPISSHRTAAPNDND